MLTRAIIAIDAKPSMIKIILIRRCILIVGILQTRLVVNYMGVLEPYVRWYSCSIKQY